ncbi:putative periplasmic dipeptidase [Fulvivirga imtechensis AK7]|uniref:Putative periplasmic dipeptidase n=1 Tax=Fulvivirga imtechensis AK7 TaxID=1237149 RepID=L8JGY2_9BACT|nr:dipeptidase [Fulvivirga imtechensis]ELR68090.1 putative periplasmic dipeptidase [Fulvivirga imtechensis AK7]
MKISKSALLLLIVIVFAACQPAKEEESKKMDEAQLKIRANELAHKYIITDGHIDLPYRLKASNFKIEEDKDILIKTDKGDFDYERCKQGGLDAPFMSIYIPASYQETGGAKELADTLINLVNSIATTFPDKFAVATSPAEVEQHFKAGRISLPMGMENGAPIGDDLANVAYFHQRGIRYITLTHSKDNLICDSSYDTTRTWNGLSPFGIEVVKEMNKVGIMVDISHVSDSTFYHVMEVSKAPAIASHSSCRHFTPGFERNMSDDMIKLLAEKGGVIQINFGSTFIDQRSRDIRAHTDKYLKENNLNYGDSLAQAYIKEYQRENPIYSTVQKVVDHIDRVVKIAGIDHVGLGSDFDGVGDTLPDGIKDVSQYPNLIFELLKRGYSDEDIEKICYKNVFRVWNEVEKVAKESK